MVSHWLVQALHPRKNSEHPPFWNGWNYRIKNYGVKVNVNNMTSLFNNNLVIG
jgi:hypothetical protein